jgi:hypothetical protein
MLLISIDSQLEYRFLTVSVHQVSQAQTQRIYAGAGANTASPLPSLAQGLLDQLMKWRETRTGGMDYF